METGGRIEQRKELINRSTSAYRQVTFMMLWEVFIEEHRNDKLENRITEELQALVVAPREKTKIKTL